MTPETARIVLEIHKALEMDLEMGSHHLTNARSREFAGEYPRLLKAIMRHVPEAHEVEEAHGS